MQKKSVLKFSFVKKCLFVGVLLPTTFALSNGLEKDSLRTHTLQTLVVSGNRQQVSGATLPMQIFTEKEIATLNAVNVTDIAKYFSGVSIKDYGGIGGLKTVSLRGMGSQYTGVSYDGVMMSDIQSGQIDLGRFSLDNVSEVSLTYGQPNDIFQTARIFSATGVLSLKTKMLESSPSKTFSGKLSMKTGSFGLLNPNIFITKNFGEKWSFNLSTDVLWANGRYTFTQYYGSKANLSEELKRTNSDVKSLRSEINGLYSIGSKESVSFKVNYFGSERGLPGSVTFYNNDPSQQRLHDKTYLAQIHYKNRMSEIFQHQYFAKFNSSYNHFTDVDAKYVSTNGVLNDSYLQKEYYLSSSFQLKILNPLFVSASADWWYNGLNIDSNVNFEDFQYPTRHTGMANLALKYSVEKMTLGANLLYTLTHENVRYGNASPDRSKLSPCISASYKVMNDGDFRIRAFFKNIYRLPSFNDLYYQDMGNPNLLPEDIYLYNLGITYFDNNIPFLSEFTVMVDGYYNNVVNKIIAIPQDMFHWSMTNKDNVKIKGMDVSLKMSVKAGKSDRVNLKANYSLKSAKDATRDSENFGEQIPYTPVHAATASLSYQSKLWEAGYNFLLSGTRWIGQTTQKSNRMDGYMTHSVFVNTAFKQWKFTAEIINILNAQYEVVKFYPMPRRNFRLTIAMEF